MPETYFLFMDETNREPSKEAEFFIYGGAIVPQSSLSDMHAIVSAIRADAGYLTTDSFKFAPHSRPKHVTPAKFRAAKKQIMSRCGDLGIEFVACLVLHDLAKARNSEVLIEWGANTILGAFNEYLAGKNAQGVVVADRFSGRKGFAYCKEKFQVGLKFPGGATRTLENIMLYSFSCDGASHAMSAADILLGGFRYCVNQRDRADVSKKILGQLASMIWAREVGGVRHLSEWGLRIRPKNVRSGAYQARYDSLIAHLNELMNG